MRHFVCRLAILAVVVLLVLGRSTTGLSQPRVQPDFRYALDSLRLRSMPHHNLDDLLKTNGHHRNPLALRKVVSPASQFYLFDTAIVRSITFQDTTRHLYSFNVNGKRISDLTQMLTGGQWVDNRRQTSTYHARGNMLTDLYENWSDSQWVGSQRFTYTYDANNNMLTDLYETWSNGQWVGLYRSTYTYDTNGNRLTDLDEGWSNGQWVGIERITYTYEASGNTLTQVDEVWSNGQWVNSARYSFAYDANGKMISNLEEDWSNGQWVNAVRFTYTNDAKGNRLTEVDESWSNGLWVSLYRFTYTYDANGNRLTEVDEDCSNGQWVNSVRLTYTYDIKENLASFWSFSWASSSWTPWDFPVSTPEGLSLYDSAGNYYIFPSAYNITITYKTILTGVASERGNAPAIFSLSQNYPNPFNPSTTIKYTLPSATQVKLSVYDILGREVSVLVNDRRDAGVYEIKFDGSNLASGVYFYRLQAGDYVASKKMLVLK
jgi:hypothetical protein